jgi:hypothetical protein
VTIHAGQRAYSNRRTRRWINVVRGHFLVGLLTTNICMFSFMGVSILYLPPE